MSADLPPWARLVRLGALALFPAALGAALAVAALDALTGRHR